MSLSEAFSWKPLSPRWPTRPSCSDRSASVSRATSQHLSVYSCQSRRGICSPLGKWWPSTCPSQSRAWMDRLPLCPLQLCGGHLILLFRCEASAMLCYSPPRGWSKVIRQAHTTGPVESANMSVTRRAGAGRMERGS